MGVFGWDYPPGVTGREPQIAGHTRECEEQGSDCPYCAPDEPCSLHVECICEGFDEYEPDEPEPDDLGW